MATETAQSNTEIQIISNEELATVAGGGAEPVAIKGIDLPDIDQGAIQDLRDRLDGTAAEDTKGYVVF